MTVRLIIHKIRDAVESLYGKHEAEAIARMVVCNKLNYNLSQLVVRYDEECEVEGLERMVAELKSGRPVQYVLGEAEFCDMVFEVQEGVLIPRPETEELVYRIVETAPRSVRILDVGTGSGAIAISLANMVEGARVAAVDISKEALAVAQRNAERLGAEVEFVEADALGDMSHLGEFDVIVSNPPYIPQSDIAEMRKNVVDFEPHTALFVPDDDALKFYRSIARNARTMLAEGGVLWFEIYEKFGTEMCEMLYDEGFAQCGVEVDANDKARMVWAKL
ncbi:MAG: peptide chain release factor N(5)-glutamine methyltransferase [Rikenellaceae bacterium]|nr:peptide chain release factor N(5)-glutamine methyltransferase [Rikenellaceae bacterium]